MEHLHRGPDVLRALDDDNLDEPVAVDPRELVAYADRVVDLAGQIESLATSLPAREIMVDRDRVAAGADRALRGGIATPDRALDAIGYLPLTDTCRAFAHIIATQAGVRAATPIASCSYAERQAIAATLRSAADEDDPAQ